MPRWAEEVYIAKELGITPADVRRMPACDVEAVKAWSNCYAEAQIEKSRKHEEQRRQRGGIDG